jgi:hypothetical protein
MDKSQMIASALAVLFVLSLIIFRLLWAGSQVAAADGLGRFPRFPKRLRRWLFGEPHHS